MVSWLWPWPSYRTWRRRRRKLTTLAYLSKVADIKARIAMAPSRAKAEIEMDLRWASPLDRTWRDEIVTVVFALPIVGLFIPGCREYIFHAFDDLKRLDDNAPSLFIWGWAIIFGTTFGIRGIKSMFMPTKIASLVKAMGEVQQVSDTDLETAQRDAVSPPPSVAQP